jgi:hypothetical protein
VLAFASLALASCGLALWSSLGTNDGSIAEHGPWPLVLGIAFGFGLIGAGCGLVALVLGPASRRRATSALCMSLVAPLAVGIIALAMFFSSTSLSWGL